MNGLTLHGLPIPPIPDDGTPDIPTPNDGTPEGRAAVDRYLDTMAREHAEAAARPNPLDVHADGFRGQLRRLTP